MTKYFVSVLISFLAFQLIASENNLDLIKQEIEKSENALVIKNRADEAILHALKAQKIYESWEKVDLEIAKTIQLKFIGAFQSIDQAENAIIHLKNLQELSLKTDGLATRSFYLNAGRLAGNFNSIGKRDSAYAYYLKALKSATSMNDSLYISSAKNNIGMYYMQEGKWELANQFYDEALFSLALNDQSDSIFLRNILDNKADYYLYKGDTVASIELIDSNLNYLFNFPSAHEMIIRYAIKLIRIHLDRGQFLKAASLINKAKSYIHYGKEEWQIDNAITLAELKLQLFNQKQSNNDQSQTLRYLDSLRKKQLSFLIRQNRNISKTMNQYMVQAVNREIDILEEKQIQIEKDNRSKSILLVAALIIGIIISSLIWLSYKRRLAAQASEKKLKEKELKLSVLENEKLNRTLKHQSSDFSDLVMQMTLKEDWSTDIAVELDKLCKGTKTIDVSEIKKLMRSLKQKSNIYQKLELKQKGIKEVNSAFFERLEKQYPNLTKSEKELCGLIKLKLDGKEIATIRNIAPSSVRKLRHRLRKKMNLSSDVDIYEIIDKI